MTSPASERVLGALERAATWQPRTNAFVEIFGDDARADVAGVEPSDTRPLAGVPVAIKDLFDVRGHPTTGCCAAIPADPAERDAPLVQRLRAAGAIVIGKTNQHELAAGVTNVESSRGPTRNPWDPSRMTGGSSGGSAAAVAAGIVPVSLGSDTGGSIRIPASFCGTWGLKVTHGRLPVDGMMPLVPRMDSPGVLAGSLVDLRAGWEALTGSVATAPAPTIVGTLRGARWERCHADVRDALDRALATLGAFGVEVRDVEGSGLDDVHDVWNGVAWPAVADLYGGLADDPALGPATASLLRWSVAHRHLESDALSRAERIRRWFANAFADVDLLLTATTPYVAPRLDAVEVDLGDGSTMDVHRGGPAWFTTAANVAGLPAMSVPFAWTRDDLPIGVQLIGPPNGEAPLLSGAELLHAPERPPLPEP